MTLNTVNFTLAIYPKSSIFPIFLILSLRRVNSGLKVEGFIINLFPKFEKIFIQFFKGSPVNGFGRCSGILVHPQNGSS